MPDRERVTLLRKTYGFVFQQHFLINYLTALENVMVAAPEQDKTYAAQAEALLADLGMEDKLHRFPYELSGGERQRICLARALIRDPELLLLDEATNALDSISEDLIHEALDNMRQKRAVVVIAHRLATIESADQILVLDGGRLVEQGDLRHLIAQDGLFAHLYKATASSSLASEQTQFAPLYD